MTAEPRTATTADVERLSAALAAAFHDDPVWSWLLPNARRRPPRLRRFFDIELRHLALVHGSVWVPPDLTGASLAMPPGHWRMPVSVTVARSPGFVRVLGARLPIALGLLTRMEWRHLREPHYYFPYIGVTPAAQGRGLGSRLMRPTLERCDAEGLPAYLEATNARNVALYERLGFEGIDDLTFAGSPPLRLMVRRPQA